MKQDYTADLEEIKDIVAMTNPKVRKNIKIVTAEDIGQTKVYHISLDRRTKFFPNISKRAGSTEDNTLPRVHTAPNLIDCWFGYAAGGDLAANYTVNDSKKKVSQNSNKISEYKGGFYIHEIDFRCGLMPNNDLVYDADFTNEIWLVTYNPLTVSFPTVSVGMIFTHHVSFYPRTGKYPLEVATLYLKVEKNKEIHFTKLNKFYKSEKNVPDIIKGGFWSFDVSDEWGVQNFKPITEKEFLEQKTRSAAMLSY